MALVTDTLSFPTTLHVYDGKSGAHRSHVLTVLDVLIGTRRVRLRLQLPSKAYPIWSRIDEGVMTG